jgi:hypothetical protein
MARQFSLPSPVRPGKTDKWLICESLSDLAARKPRKMGGDFGQVAPQRRLAATGELTRVAAADKYLAKLEEVSILSGKRVWENNVTGALPDVGAFVAGSPLSMRSRRKTRDDSAPLGIIFDGTTSGGISHSDMEKRGTVVLALVRLLAMRRPIELWLAAGLGGANGQGSWIATRLDTAPLDLARACYALSNPLATRVLGYESIQGEIEGAYGAWPYNGGALSATDFHKVCAQAFPHLTDILAIPGIIISDDMVKKPEAWLRAQVAKYCDGEGE